MDTQKAIERLSGIADYWGHIYGKDSKNYQATDTAIRAMRELEERRKAEEQE